MRSINRKLFFLWAILVLAGGACNTDQEIKPPPVKLDTEQLIQDLKVLSSDEMEGRKTGTVGNRKAREYLVNRFKEEGAKPYKGSYVHSFTFKNRSGKNLEGLNIMGVVEGQVDSVIVVSAHYDHMGMRDSLIYNGADDNASGTAALPAYIDYFSENTPKHTMIFVAFDAEEMGLQGARAFVQDSVLMDRVVLNVNMDMIAQNRENELYASGTYHSPELKTVLEGIETGELQLMFGHDIPGTGYEDWTLASDHGPFHTKGKKFIYFGVEDHEHYHRDTDDFETIPQSFYKKSVRVILNALLALDKR